MGLLKWLQKKTRYTMSNENIFTPSLQEDPRTHESIKKTRKAFEDQQQQMHARAMKAHAADCPDPWTCTKSPCFINEPDKIVGIPKRIKNKRVVRLEKERLEKIEAHIQFVKNNQEALFKRSIEIQKNKDYDSVIHADEINNKLDI